jgi:hypothetical protein
MSEKPEERITGHWIVSQRGPKNRVETDKPYAWLVEKERTASGKIEDTGIIFLTNRECPFHCLMCDLWKNTTNDTVPPGSIPAQIEFALSRMTAVKHLKLYNSGSFFDPAAVPLIDYPTIAKLLTGFETIIVESHPRFINENTIRFKSLLKPELHVAIGLETMNPEVLQQMNKAMTTDDFIQAVHFLRDYQIFVRAFILVKPPFMSEEEGIYWAKKSVDFAFYHGVECCTVIPVRAGNGAMEALAAKGLFSPPDIRSLETVLEYGISLKKGRVFADTWDLQLFSKCEHCLSARTERIIRMNLSQTIESCVDCRCTPA